MSITVSSAANRLVHFISKNVIATLLKEKIKRGQNNVRRKKTPINEDLEKTLEESSSDSTQSHTFTDNEIKSMTDELKNVSVTKENISKYLTATFFHRQKLVQELQNPKQHQITYGGTFQVRAGNLMLLWEVK